jgi:hypothetical protein
MGGNTNLCYYNLLKKMNFERTTPLINTTSNTYRNTSRAHVIEFIERLSPTAIEAPYLASVFAKNSLSMRDFKILCDFIARRAAETPLERDCIEALGLPSLPHGVRQEVTA